MRRSLAILNVRRTGLLLALLPGTAAAGRATNTTIITSGFFCETR